MTNKKSIWAFVLAFMLVVPAMFLFSACGKHKHSFSSDWSKSETQHWHDCTDKKCEEKSDKICVAKFGGVLAFLYTPKLLFKTNFSVRLTPFYI